MNYGYSLKSNNSITLPSGTGFTVATTLSTIPITYGLIEYESGKYFELPSGADVNDIKMDD